MSLAHSECRLVAITAISEVRQLRDMYQRSWPAHSVGYYCLDNFVRWLEIRPDIQNLQILTLNGDWRSDGLFLIVDRYQLFLGSLETDNNDALEKALGLLDWSGGLKVSSFRECHRPAVLKIVEQKNLRVEYDSLTRLYRMPAEQALKLQYQVPPGFSVQPLRAEKDAATVDAIWPNQHRGSLFLIRRLIDWNANMGVFVAGGDELVAWCLRLQGGFLGALQVKDLYQRLGLGSVVTCATARRIAELGHDVMALVGKDNAPSCGMFEKLGFRVEDNCYWLRTYPTEEGREWPDQQ